jgi:hypothetical protein
MRWNRVCGNASDKYFIVNQKINSFVPLLGGAQGWVYKK